MNTDRFERVERLFAGATRLSPEERGRWLEDQCADDPALRDEVLALLDADACSAGRDVEPAPVLARVDGMAPERIGDFRILGVLGEGGMGVVYEAEQAHPQRLVALKVMRSWGGSVRALRRFEQEADVLGRLQHHGIARIYEAGTDAGVAYFAMELVRGRSLGRYVREEGCDIPRRLEIFAEVCDAVHHAHLHGVVHRDLKPGNILVDGAGRPKVLDFGVARLTDSDVRSTTLRTEAGQIIGTLAYMSPEQVEGDPRAIDPRTDVYALGVILHELLSGELPYAIENRPITEAARVIREEEPTRLGLSSRTLRGDLETIALKVL